MRIARAQPSARATAQARFAEGEGFLRQGQFDKALAAYRAAVQKDPEMSAAWFAIGMVEMVKNDAIPCEAAYGPFKRCLELNPDNAGAHCGLGSVLLHVRKDYARAEEHLRASIELNPKLAPAHQGLARVLDLRGDLDGAIREMLAYVTLSGDPDGSGKAHAAALLEKKKAGGSAAKPDAEAQARFPPPLVAPAPRPRVTSYD